MKNKMNQTTYTVRPIVCPRCGKKLVVEKRRDRSSIHTKRMRVLAKHINEVHRDEQPDSRSAGDPR